jgi:tetratricopeptide (TPR) repeat protein
VKESEAAGLSSREQAFAAGQLAGFLEQRGDLAEAEPVLRKAAALYGSEPYAECDQAETFGDLAYVRGAQNDIAGSVLLFRKAYIGLVACSGADTRSSLMMQAHLAGAMLKAHQAADVVPMLEASLPAWRKISGNSPDLANPMIFLARAYLADKQYTQAESMAAQTVAVQAGKIAAKTYRMGVSELVWAQALAAQGRNADALLHAQRAVDGVTANPAKTAAQKETVQQAQELVEALKNK